METRQRQRLGPTRRGRTATFISRTIRGQPPVTHGNNCACQRTSGSNRTRRYACRITFPSALLQTFEASTQRIVKRPLAAEHQPNSKRRILFMVAAPKRTARSCVVGVAIFSLIASKAFALEFSPVMTTNHVAEYVGDAYSTTTLPPMKAIRLGLVLSLRMGQLAGSPASFGQRNVFGSYPTCSRVPLMSMRGWKVASFERLSIRVPDSFQLQRDYGSDHGGRGWRTANMSVAIDRGYGSPKPYRPAASLAYRECTTTLASLFALVQEFGANGGYSTSVSFPELGLMLLISIPNVENLALSRTIVATARATMLTGR